MPRRKKSEAEVQPEAGTEAVTEQVQQIAISELHPFEGHPFKVLDDETMAETVESIKQVGIANPLIVRPDPDGGYEIISGHRRHHAAGLAGLDALPVIVRELDDDAAVIMMVDSNLQRENILPSERAFAYKMKMDAIRHQGARSDIKKLSQDGGCELDAMCGIMNEVKKDDLGQVAFKTSDLQKYFPKSYTPKQMSDTILRLLEQW